MIDDARPNSANPATIAPQRSVSLAEVRRFAEAIGLERVAPERSSMILKFELYCHTFFVPNSSIHANKIVAEIRGLEGHGRRVGTKSAKQFKYPPLNGLWKKHYLVGGLASMARNIQIGFGSGQRELKKIIGKNFDPTTANFSPENIPKIAKAVTNIYADRSHKQRLTGEWIIFAKHEGRNYYLCLATHDEAKNYPADLFERIKLGCSYEFPFLF
jgi:hypothetical protein